MKQIYLLFYTIIPLIITNTVTGYPIQWRFYGQKKLDYQLIRSCKQGKVREIWDLLALGANVNAKDEGHTTALMYATQTVHLSSIKLLIHHGANLRAQNKDKVNALMLAANKGKLNLVKYYLKTGEDINRYDRQGNSAIMYAAEARQDEILSYLIKKKAKINIKNKKGKTALMFAISSNIQLKTIKEMLYTNALVNQSDINGITSLMLASMYNRPKVVKLLINRGAKKDAKNKNGWDALKFATNGQFKHVINTLKIIKQN